MAYHAPFIPTLQHDESDHITNETMILYDSVITNVRKECQSIISQLGYRNFMTQSFIQWYTRTYQLMAERSHAPPATAPVPKRMQPQPVKRPHSDEPDAEQHESLAKRVKREDEDGDTTAPTAAIKTEPVNEHDATKAEPAEPATKEEGDDDEELGSDLDDDDTDLTDYCSQVKDIVVCLYESISKANRNAVRRVTLCDGVIMVRGLPDIPFRRIVGHFKCA